MNLNRQFNTSQEPSSLTWLRTFVDSDREQSKQVSLGWIGQVWIFENGTLIASDKNFYYPDSERQRPDGRLSLENGTHTIPLRRGRNEITIALHSSIHDEARSRTRYGWGLAMCWPSQEHLLPEKHGKHKASDVCPLSEWVGRQLEMKMSTSLLARCWQLPPEPTQEAPITARSQIESINVSSQIAALLRALHQPFDYSAPK